jgi:hypothetical protein
MKISIGLTALVIVSLSPAIQAQMPDDNVNSDGNFNTAVGTSALFSNDLSSNQSPGIYNLAAGYQALYSNSTGSSNVATGYRALYQNYGGDYNVAVGTNALSLNVGGGFNTAAGNGALLSSNGSNNTAVGAESLGGNPEGDVSTGSNNTAVGFMAMNHFTFGSYNTASGFESLLSDTTGDYNTAVGVDALYTNSSGSSNIGIGYKAGFNLTSGKNNIDVGNVGISGESATIRIGTFATQKSIYLAGAATGLSSGSIAQLAVDTKTGQIGVGPVSSERYKTSVTSMGSATEKLGQLRPVTFRYKRDPRGPRQFGLIAEEVAKVYPELVVRDAKGQILSVRYDELGPMLLNLVQQQAAEVRELHEEVRALRDSQHR